MEIEFNNVIMINNSEEITFKTKNKKITAFISETSDDGSRILKIIGGVIKPLSGEIKISGKNLNAETIGFVHRIPRDNFTLKTIKDEIENNLNLKKYQKEDKSKRIHASLRSVGLNNSYLDKNPLELSSSEQKRISLAIALSHNPKILLLDEPTIGLDYQSKIELIKILKMMSFKYNKTILINSTDIDFLNQIADYIYFLEDGKIIKHGDKYALYKKVVREKIHIRLPKIIDFSNKVRKAKNIKLGYRNNLDDLAKDIYRSV